MVRVRPVRDRRALCGRSVRLGRGIRLATSASRRGRRYARVRRVVRRPLRTAVLLLARVRRLPLWAAVTGLLLGRRAVGRRRAGWALPV